MKDRRNEGVRSALESHVQGQYITISLHDSVSNPATKSGGICDMQSKTGNSPYHFSDAGVQTDCLRDSLLRGKPLHPSPPPPPFFRFLPSLCLLLACSNRLNITAPF